MGSHHKNQKLNQWKVYQLKATLVEFHFYEERRVKLGLSKLEKSKAHIARDHHLNPSSILLDLHTGLAFGVDLDLDPLGGDFRVPRFGGDFTLGFFFAVSSEDSS